MRVSMKKAISSLTIGAILISSTALFTADAATLSRQYTKYVYATGATSTYTLSMDEAASANTRAIVDGDNRVYETRSENDGIVQLKARIDSTKVGLSTGFIIDDHTIATAAHCVYDTNGFRYDAKVYLYDEAGTQTGNVLTVKEVHVPSDYITCVANGTQGYESNSKFDYALLTVSEDLSSHTQFSLNYAYDINNSALSDVNVHVIGIPGYEPNTNEEISNTDNLIYTGIGKIKQTTAANSQVMRYTTDTSHGDSGGPVYIIEKFNVGTNTYYNYSVLSVHHGGYTDNYNFGARVTEYLLQFYNNNPNISY